MSGEIHGRRLVLVTVGIMLALFLAALDQTIVGTALPRIVAELKGLDFYAWVLTVTLPVGLAAILFVFFTMPRTQHNATWRDIDFPGVAALTAGLAPLLVAFSITRDHPWGSPEVLGLLGVGAAVLVVFYFLERRTDHPIVPFVLFKNRTFAVAVIAGFLVAVGMFGAIVYVPLVYQGVLGIAATNSGLLITPMMVGLVIGSVSSGQLMLRVKRYRYLGTFAMGLVALGTYLMSGITVDTKELEVVRDLVIVGLGVGITFPLYLNSVQSAVEPRYIGVVTSQIQFFRNVGATIGTAVLGSFLSQRLPANIQTRIDALSLPPEIQQRFASTGGGNVQTLFDPAARANIPPAFQGVFDQVLGAVRSGLAATLHDVFLAASAAAMLALVASVFLDDVPIRLKQRGAQVPAETPAPAFGD